MLCLGLPPLVPSLHCSLRYLAAASVTGQCLCCIVVAASVSWTPRACCNNLHNPYSASPATELLQALLLAIRSLVVGQTELEDLPVAESHARAQLAAVCLELARCAGLQSPAFSLLSSASSMSVCACSVSRAATSINNLALHAGAGWRYG